jgi:broad specificity phosphatase PhoE
MSTLMLVRHGQASLFSDDYDRLSDLGLNQAEALGQFWLERKIRPDSVCSGTLNRQRQTADRVGDIFAAAGEFWPALQEIPGLNEYPAKEITESLVPELRKTDSSVDRLAAGLETSKNHADKYRNLHRLLEIVIARWVSTWRNHRSIHVGRTGRDQRANDTAGTGHQGGRIKLARAQLLGYTLHIQRRSRIAGYL